MHSLSSWVVSVIPKLVTDGNKSCRRCNPLHRDKCHSIIMFDYTTSLGNDKRNVLGVLKASFRVKTDAFIRVHVSGSIVLD